MSQFSKIKIFSETFRNLFQVVAAAGYNVTLTEVSQQLAEQSKKSVMKSAERVARKKFAKDEKLREKYVQDTMARINTSFNYEESVKNADLVIEAIVENLEAKHKLFALIDKVKNSNELTRSIYKYFTAQIGF